MQPMGGMAKDMGSLESSSVFESKNKPSKKRREAMKKKLKATVVTPETSKVSLAHKTTQEIATYKKFILVDKYNGMTITPLIVQFNTPPQVGNHLLIIPIFVNSTLTVCFPVMKMMSMRLLILKMKLIKILSLLVSIMMMMILVST